jgi:hypothetical protein
VLATMVVWSLIGTDELDPAKQEGRAGFGPATKEWAKLVGKCSPNCFSMQF